VVLVRLSVGEGGSWRCYSYTHTAFTFRHHSWASSISLLSERVVCNDFNSITFSVPPLARP